MSRKNGITRPVWMPACLLFLLLLCGCTPTPTPEACRSEPAVDLSAALAYADHERYIFRYPLDELTEDANPSPANFCKSNWDGSELEYHAAEDYHLPAGTPVYAFADGTVSFSGPMGGYGWLVIIDHPQANIYSLYGHLSPSRWRLRMGPVKKGDLIAYLGDGDENGGSARRPLVTHLHFGIRAGQRSDYSGLGEWRWQAGWIKPCPRDLGWLRPSEVITSQEIPTGGFQEPPAKFLAKWGVELIFFSIYLVGAVSFSIFAVRKEQYLLWLIAGFFLTLAGWVFYSKGTRMSYALFLMAFLLVSLAGYQLVQRAVKGRLAA